MACRAPKITSCFFAFIFLSLPVYGQSTEAGISARLKDKPLYLRGFWRDANLKFDADGELASQSSPSSFTLSGFEFHSAHIKKDKLQLEGKRIGIEFIKDTPQRVALGQKVKLEIVPPASGDFTQALDAIFADGLAEIIPSLPSYWQHWANSTPVPPRPASALTVDTRNVGSAAQSPAGDLAAKKVGGVVHAPTLTAHHEAQYNEAARKLRYSGSAVISMVVSREGLPTRLYIIRPLGLGLDEQALAAVQKYGFLPALEDGKPVPVEVNVEVNFQIF